MLQNETDKKCISISGINSRYQIKKLTQEKKISKRKNMSLLEQQEEIFSFSFQEKELNDLFTKTSTSNNSLNNCLNNCLFIKEIKNKLSSYKQQDILKKRLNSLEFVSLDYIIQKLYECKLKCFYCSCETYVLYKNVRENKQWTLDRIDNNQGHNRDNIVISCLECNLKRKTKNKDAFLFTKNLQITREMYKK